MKGNPPSLDDYGLISDCHAAALVSRGGSIDWCCLPRFDSGSCFARLLDPERGGHFELTPPRGADTELQYLDGTMVLETSIEHDGARARILDCFVIGDERRLLRIVEGLEGEMTLGVDLAPRFDYGEVHPWMRRDGDGLFRVIGGNDGLVVASDVPLEIVGEHTLQGELTVAAGERVRFVLTYVSPEHLDHAVTAPLPADLDQQLQDTESTWRERADALDDRARDLLVVRSALTLHALVYDPTGAIIAAPTTSLPESPSGTRTWDYRFSWVRDSTLAVRQLVDLGADDEADAFARFVMRSAAGHADELQVAYGVGGERRIGASEIDLAGYGGARPVRTGNDAIHQRQHDELGEIVSLAWRWHMRGHVPDDDEWRFIASVVEAAARRWRDRDFGFWEWPGDPRHFVYSKATCFAALNRGLALAEALRREVPVERWETERDAIRDVVLDRGFDAKAGTFVQALDDQQVDSTSLLLPVTGIIDWDDERMLSTADVVADRLDDRGLLRRYEADDGLPGREGAFLACSFWLAECLARQGREDEARERYDRTLEAATPLGLFAEEYDTRRSRPLGNFPQGLTHLAHIGAALALAGDQALSAPRSRSPSST